MEVMKTYKMFIGGAFPRTESGRYYELTNPKGEFVANICRGSRKDFRNAAVAARAAQKSWAGKSAYNRSQIIYRIAEIMQQRKSQFVEELTKLGYTAAKANKEFDAAIDLLVYYAGWCDKYVQVSSAVNPVASSHFNFSIPEPTGLVSVIAHQDGPLVGLLQAFVPAIVGGNAVVVLASEKYAMSAVSLAEVLATSDVPGGVVNILTGFASELAPIMASHMDVNALVTFGLDRPLITSIAEACADSVKRLRIHPDIPTKGSLDLIMELQEIKTTWHPIEKISSSGSAY